MKKYGLIGYPLSHSFSPSFFAKKFENEGITDCEYKAYPIQHILEVQQLMDDGILGFNVTIPYKEDIVDFMDDLDSTAGGIGAVNCVKREGDKWKGYNTDAYGFKKSLLTLIGQNFNGRAMVLGTGGAAKAVLFALNELNIPFSLVSRRAGLMTYEKMTKEDIANHLLIINCTPLGMYPKVAESPKLPYDALTDQHLLYDLVYNPKVTKFLEEGLKRGSKIKNGEDMLVLQAEKSWEIWNQ